MNENSNPIIYKIYAQRCLSVGEDTKVENIGADSKGKVWFFTYIIFKSGIYTRMSRYNHFIPYLDTLLPVGNGWYHTHHAEDFKGTIKNDIK